jgi:tRNA pseudouridine38-40 synthase
MSDQRFFLELAYDGTAYSGWQRQPNALSVQEVIECQLQKLMGNVPVSITGCGRTDTGVHARFFVAHVDLPQTTDPQQLTYKLNKMLPGDIAILNIFPVASELHARFSATMRTYRYFVHLKKDAFARNSLYVPNDLSVDHMNTAAECLLGTQDFTSLSKLHTDVKTNRCTVYAAKWVVQQDGTMYFEISADRFLRNMVRATVGTLLEVGTGKLTPQEVTTILAAKDRGAAKTSVPACGLFLWHVAYEK